ncbi:21655_t:CDS:2 [Gigaspora rosea]|nr:21655_t:CDS:2 [Gigaspora rosea]
MPNEESKIDIVTEIGGRKRLYCHECQYFFMLILLHGDEQRNEILERLEKEGLIRNCYICQRKNLKRRMHNEGQSFFCTREEKYGAVVYWEVSDPTRNYDLATRINYHCYSSKSAGSGYDMNIDMIFRITKVLLKQTTLTINEALRKRQEDKYSLEYEDADNYYPNESGYYHPEHIEETENREFPDLAEALERLLETFTEWTTEMATSKTEKTFPEGYYECEACHMCFNKVKSTEELEKIYSIDEEKEIYYCKGYCYNIEILKLSYCRKCTGKNLLKKPHEIENQICDEYKINHLTQRLDWFESTVKKQQEDIDLLKHKLDLMNSQKRIYLYTVDPRTQAQQIIEGSLVANPEFQSRILNDDEDIFMDEREAFEEALNQNIQKQNKDLIDLTDNTDMKGLYYSPILEPNERPIRRARSASPRLGRSATPTSPTIKITINN